MSSKNLPNLLKFGHNDISSNNLIKIYNELEEFKNNYHKFSHKIDKYSKLIEITINFIIEAEIRILEKHLKAMEDSLRKMKGSLEKIFVARYIDGLTINQICRKVNYSRPQVYRKLKIINKIIKDETK
jgi:hypothetical protein